MSFDSLIGNPVFDEYRRQVDDPDALVNLTPLWRAAGSPKGRSPRQWDAGCVKNGCESEIVRDDGGGPDGAVWATGETAFHYIQVVDDAVLDAICKAFMRSLREDPARHMAGCPDGVMALFAVSAMAEKEGVSFGVAADRLVEEVEGRTADMDTFSQETLVAKVARAARAVEVSRPA